jgi:HlyD family secretion protein
LAIARVERHMKDNDIDAALDLAPRRNPLWRRLGLVTALSATALGVGLWFAQGSPAPDPFVVERVARGPLTVTVTATGTVEPTNLVEISSELSGTMRAVLVDHNDRVEVGQQLAQLDTAKLDAQLAHARASLAARLARVAEAQATLREASDQKDRVAALADRNVSTTQARDAAVANLRRAEAALAVTRADADVARADLLLDETNLAKASICSPIRGVVLERNVEPGQIVASSLNTPILFTIA